MLDSRSGFTAGGFRLCRRTRRGSTIAGDGLHPADRPRHRDDANPVAGAGPSGSSPHPGPGQAGMKKRLCGLILLSGALLSPSLLAAQDEAEIVQLASV